jgi:hypothetical protein
MHVEHIDPGGGDDPDNLCLSCSSCNLSKSIATSARGPETGQEIALFNPRIQVWLEHFEWIDDELRLRGTTSVGRVTIVAFEDKPATTAASKKELDCIRNSPSWYFQHWLLTDLAFDNLPYSCPMDAQCCTYLTVVHTSRAHIRNYWLEMLFVRIMLVTYSS